jgi:hypothetical protein
MGDRPRRNLHYEDDRSAFNPNRDRSGGAFNDRRSRGIYNRRESGGGYFLIEIIKRHVIRLCGIAVILIAAFLSAQGWILDADKDLVIGLVLGALGGAAAIRR